jgi:hypothetical protein
MTPAGQPGGEVGMTAPVDAPRTPPPPPRITRRCLEAVVVKHALRFTTTAEDSGIERDPRERSEQSAQREQTVLAKAAAPVGAAAFKWCSEVLGPAKAI